jgi:photosystem II stability/assembly factor-like uncharacterized protein
MEQRRRKTWRTAAIGVALVLALALCFVACAGGSGSKTSTAAVPTPAATATSTPVPAPTAAATATASDRFYTVRFVSAQVGWAAGERGIFATTDGGMHWTPQLSEPRDGVTQLDFVDSQTGFALEPILDVAGGSQSGGVDVLLYTTDGGAHWDARMNWTPVRFTDIAFGAATTGWAIGYQEVDDHAGTLYRTSDGGESWTVVFSPAQSVCFDDANIGWLAAGGEVKRTVDGGATWTTVFTNPAAGEGDKAWGGPVECKGRDVVWVTLADGVAAGSEAYLISRTVNGGKNWQSVIQSWIGPSLGVHVGAGVYPGPVSVVDANDTFVVGTCPACEEGNISPFPSVIEATHDGGLTWDAPDAITDAGTAVESLSFVDAEHGWLATQNGVFATTDGGRTWIKQLP